MKKHLPASGKNSLKFDLYESAVQSPEIHMELFEGFYKVCSSNKKRPQLLREDFCGSAALSRAWIQWAPRMAGRCAYGIDLDQETLTEAKRRVQENLTPSSAEKIQLLRQDVRQKTSFKADVIAACNFSFNIFKKRSDLKVYIKNALSSLAPGGVMVFEVGGGPGMTEKLTEKRKCRHKKWGRFQYEWSQGIFNPVSNECIYRISFRSPTLGKFPEAFIYDWRLWSIPELQDIIEECSYKYSLFWEEVDIKERTRPVVRVRDYIKVSQAPHYYSWVAYLVAHR